MHQHQKSTGDKKMKKLTGNQKIAQYILGHIPKGYVVTCEKFNIFTNYRVGEIAVDGKIIASIPSFLNGGKLPS
jgi:hypothetical protein